jgi:broad specificity phosphatase PhoE
MAVVYLIRHGQASFGKQDYDQLSPIGERQARVIGHHMHRFLPGLDCLCSGGMVRQDRSAEIAREAMGKEPPPLRTVPAFAEYDHVALFRAYLPSFLSASDNQAGTLEELLEDRQQLERALRHVLTSWMQGDPHEGPPVLAWPEFCAGAGTALAKLLSDSGPKSRLAIFTSGGIISALLCSLLDLSAQRALGLAISLYNASITQLYCPADGGIGDILLMGYNNITHLEMTGDRDLITFR